MISYLAAHELDVVSDQSSLVSVSTTLFGILDHLRPTSYIPDYHCTCMNHAVTETDSPAIYHRDLSRRLMFQELELLFLFPAVYIVFSCFFHDHLDSFVITARLPHPANWWLEACSLSLHPYPFVWSTRGWIAPKFISSVFYISILVLYTPKEVDYGISPA